MNDGNFGIIVSGGPAPGINTVIASVVVQASNQGFKVKGLNRGFLGVISEGNNAIKDLTPEEISPLATTGGSILGTSRYNPFADKESEEKLFSTLRENNIDKLVVIGGEGSAYLSYQLSKKMPTVKIAHIPKTIDNDLILPNKHPSFGFETARFVGSNIMKTITADAKTTHRWFIVRTMGRKAGFLAMGQGISSGASLTIIAEQFDGSERIKPEDVVDIIFQSVKKRLSLGKGYGTAIIAEGIIDKFNPDQVDELKNCPRDDMGRLRFAEVELEDILARKLRERCAEEGIDIRFSTSSIGYELRCREPVPFDIEYCRLLGYGAVKYLLDGREGFMVVRDFDNLAYVPLHHMIDENTGLLRTRKVDLNSDVYKVSSSFMIK